MLDQSKIRRFYLEGFREKPALEKWPRMWSKQFKIRTHQDRFISLNRFRPRFNFRTLRKYLIHYAPTNIYMSALNWLMPERVGWKKKANHTYPLGGEIASGRGNKGYIH